MTGGYWLEQQKRGAEMKSDYGDGYEFVDQVLAKVRYAERVEKFKNREELTVKLAAAERLFLALSEVNGGFGYTGVDGLLHPYDHNNGREVTELCNAFNEAFKYFAPK